MPERAATVGSMRMASSMHARNCTSSFTSPLFSSDLPPPTTLAPNKLREPQRYLERYIAGDTEGFKRGPHGYLAAYQEKVQHGARAEVHGPVTAVEDR
eukprot:2440585-Rhodomonas_salina.3